MNSMSASDPRQRESMALLHCNTLLELRRSLEACGLAFLHIIRKEFLLVASQDLSR
jgi:hypothetical protein